MPALYTPELLSLATELIAYPIDRDFVYCGQARSQTCGSSMDLAFDLADGAMGPAGAQVTACAIGQASAALFLRHAIDRRASELLGMGTQMAKWLKGGDRPDFPSLALLEGARNHLGRHGAIMLPWNALRAALENGHRPR